jgi:hypothetical protein
MRESRTYGSVRGNSRPYHDGSLATIAHSRLWHSRAARVDSAYSRNRRSSRPCSDRATSIYKL